MSSYVGASKPFNNYENGFPYPSNSDPSNIWTIDEDDILSFDALYGKNLRNEDDFYHQPAYLLNGVHFPDIKPQFPLTSIHASLSMPVLPTPANLCQKVLNNTPNFQQPAPQIPEGNYNPPQLIAQNNVLHHLPAQHDVSERTMATFVDLKPFYEKGQVRLQGKSEQRLDYSTSFVRIYLDKPENVKSKTAFVERYPDAAHILKDSIGSVPLKVVAGENQSWIKVNLDDAGCDVYKLSKVKGEERNRFHIVLELLFHDLTTKRFYSDTFQVKSKPKIGDYLLGDSGFEDVDKTINFVPDTKRKTKKRSRTDDNDVMTPSPGSVGSSIFPEVITDHLQATTATIDQLKILQPIQTQRGDIAYNFKLNKRPSDPVLEEGDIIGFFETCDGNTEIKSLTCQNVHDAKLAGVVSRSAWLEGKMPEHESNEPTDMVCVIGVVKVKVRGRVTNGERIYASLTSYPGVAMAENVITQVTSNDLTLLGQSLETVECSEPDQINLISCFVSILLSIQSKHTAKAMKEMKCDVLVDVDVKIAKEKKRCIRGVMWKLALLFLFLGLVSILLWQLYAPQTAYRYWKCKQGSTGETSSFTFTKSNLMIARVNGVEFHFTNLLDKLDFNNDTRKINNFQDHRYYLNIDRCAAGGLTSDVHGPIFYVVNNECSKAYYYFKLQYQQYKTQENIVCSHYIPEIFPTIFTQCDVESNNGNASFTYTSSTTQLVTIAAGIQVDLDTIQEKTKESIKKLLATEVRYFFNVDRCTGNGGGPQYFAIVGACDRAYYFSEIREQWKIYSSAKDIKCSISIQP